MNAIIALKKIAKEYDGIKVLKDVTFDIKEGEITAIIGTNGSGKTTLLDMLTGLLQLSEGRIVIKGDSKNALSIKNLYKLGIARVFQESKLSGQMTVLDNILLVNRIRNPITSLFLKHDKEKYDEAEMILKIFGIWDKRNILALRLSYGQRKLLEIARALIMNPEILLLDEPFAGLSKVMSRKLIIILQQLKSAGRAIVLVEHDLNIITKLADNSVVLENGEIIARGQTKQILNIKKVKESYVI